MKVISNDDEFKKTKKEIDSPDFTYKEGLLMIFNRSLLSILGIVFHPTYLLVNITVLGKLKPDPIICADENSVLKHPS